MSEPTAVVFSCGHADPSVSNERFTWLGKFLYDLRPDYVVDLGDGADMRSLNMYDSGKPTNLVAENYERDIDAYNDSQERIRHLFKKNRKKRPAFYGFEGNHENRIKKAISIDPRIEGSKYGISFKHLETNRWFDEYHEYEYGAPKIHSYNGVDYAHYVTSGNSPRAISGIHHGYTLVRSRLRSVSVGHSHKRDIYFHDNTGGQGAIGLVAGCYKGASESWAGQSNDGWWKGVVIKRGISDGIYGVQFVSLEAIRRQYS